MAPLNCNYSSFRKWTFCTKKKVNFNLRIVLQSFENLENLMIIRFSLGAFFYDSAPFYFQKWKFEKCRKCKLSNQLGWIQQWECIALVYRCRKFTKCCIRLLFTRTEPPLCYIAKRHGFTFNSQYEMLFNNAMCYRYLSTRIMHHTSDRYCFYFWQF